jgi:hypothetical protein
MPLFRIYRMKDSPRQQFRWAPHVSGCAAVKPKDFQEDGEVEALHQYDAWRILRESDRAMAVGDLLEAEGGQLSICKYVGFEPASWVQPELKNMQPPPIAPDPVTAGGGQPSAAH